MVQEIIGKDIWFFNNGQKVPSGDKSRSWVACMRYGFISAGQTKKDYTYARKPKTKDILCIYQGKVGFVGIGLVQETAVPINYFKLDDGKSLRNREGIIMGDTKNHGLFHLNTDPVLCEQVIKVDWKEINKSPLWMGKEEDGYFAKRPTCLSLNSETDTLRRLQDHFNVKFISDNFSI